MIKEDMERLFSEDLQRTNVILKEMILTSSNQHLSQAISSCCSVNGKQLRARLALYSRYLSNRHGSAAQTAALIEALHCASLVHDDVIDHADSRRGLPTVYKKYGTEMGIYVGDFMLARIMQHITQLRGLSPSVIHRVMGCIEDMTYAEIDQHFSRGSKSVTWETWKDIARLKTSSLFLAAFLLGYNKSNPKLEKMIIQFGIDFQLANDLQDWGLLDNTFSFGTSDFHEGYINGVLAFLVSVDSSYKAKRYLNSFTGIPDEELCNAMHDLIVESNVKAELIALIRKHCLFRAKELDKMIESAQSECKKFALEGIKEIITRIPGV